MRTAGASQDPMEQVSDFSSEEVGSWHSKAAGSPPRRLARMLPSARQSGWPGNASTTNRPDCTHHTRQHQQSEE